jgi:two-component system, OmpR family, heavy metal sensor histidine kinase CusS
MIPMASPLFERLSKVAHLARLASKSLRARLMIWNVFLVLVTALACFLGVREGLRQALVGGMDSVLTADIREIGLDVADLHATAADLRSAAKGQGFARATRLLNDLNRKESVHEHNGWFVELLDADEKRLWASDLTPELLTVEKSRRDMAPVSLNGRLGAVDSPYRVLENRQATSQGRPLRIRVGAPMDFVDRDIGSIDRIAIRGVVLLLVAAPLLGYWLARRAIRPLSDIIETTARLRPNRMEERLAIRQTDDELDRLSATVNEFLDRIAVYLSQSNNLLANSAHELRTPLAAIRSSIEVAIGGHRTPQEYQELLSEVIGECASLERLVNQLLLLAETDSELIRAHSEQVDLSGLVARCAEMFSAVAEARQIELVTAIVPQIRVMGFGNHLRQVVNNLLDNAIKFTEPGGTVRVSLFREGGSSILRIADTGSGIPAADLPHIFERFFRGDRSRQRIEQTTGTGLGLSICQAIVAAHRGRIFVETREGSGTTMTVQLPGALDAQTPRDSAAVSERSAAMATTRSDN